MSGVRCESASLLSVKQSVCHAGQSVFECVEVHVDFNMPVLFAPLKRFILLFHGFCQKLVIVSCGESHGF